MVKKNCLTLLVIFVSLTQIISEYQPVVPTCNTFFSERHWKTSCRGSAQQGRGALGGPTGKGCWAQSYLEGGGETWSGEVTVPEKSPLPHRGLHFQVITNTQEAGCQYGEGELLG